jgi:hypothetical protein
MAGVAKLSTDRSRARGRGRSPRGVGGRKGLAVAPVDEPLPVLAVRKARRGALDESLSDLVHRLRHWCAIPRRSAPWQAWARVFSHDGHRRAPGHPFLNRSQFRRSATDRAPNEPNFSFGSETTRFDRQPWREALCAKRTQMCGEASPARRSPLTPSAPNEPNWLGRGCNRRESLGLPSVQSDAYNFINGVTTTTPQSNSGLCSDLSPSSGAVVARARAFSLVRLP